MEIICITEKPHFLEAAAEFFHSRWGVPKHLYLESMTDSLAAKMPYPRWYVMMDGDVIIGGFGLIENDFMVESECDSLPWVCAVYIDKDHRGQNLGAKMLAYATSQATKLGLQRIYLNTDHIGFYEQYGWTYEGDFLHQSGDMCRVYSHIAT